MSLSRITGPLFKWFGSKWLSSRLLPEPQHNLIVEPYAGSAGYSLRHFTNRVIVWDDDCNLQTLWRFLVKASHFEILDIPIDIPEGTDIRSLGLSTGQAMLLKHWQRTNNVGNTWTTSPWGHLPGQWTRNTRARIAAEVSAISHWEVKPIPWTLIDCTYFIDPPYEYNYRYAFKREGFSHSELAKRVMAIEYPAQIIVCEAICPKTRRTPSYLPFEFFGDRITSRRKKSENHHSKELIYERASRNFSELPSEAQEAISLRQQSYIDEFSFIEDGNVIKARYAGEILAVWDGQGWHVE